MAGVLIVALNSPVGYGGSTPRAVPQQVPPLVSAYKVTLITGDRVQLQQFPDGRQAVSITPRPNALPGLDFEQVEIGPELLVLPSDVLPYLADGVIDRALFNVSALIAHGYDDARSGQLPLIVTYRPGASRHPALPGVASPLANGNAFAVKADKHGSARFWAAASPDPATGRGDRAGPRLAGGIGRLWLDSAASDAPSIGTPPAGAGSPFGRDARPPTHRVTVTGLDRAGHPAEVTSLLIFGDDPSDDTVTDAPVGTGRTLDLPTGRYLVQGQIREKDGQRTSLVVLPQLLVDQDRRLVLDARRATQVEIRTPRPASPVGGLSYRVYRDTGLRRIASSYLQPAGQRLYVTPTPTVSAGVFEFSSRWQQQGFPVGGTPYLYDVMQVSRQRIPQQVSHTVNVHSGRTGTAATVLSRYFQIGYCDGGQGGAVEQRSGWRPWQTTVLADLPRAVPTPYVREEYVSADDTLWRNDVHYGQPAAAPGGMTQAARRYQPGQRLTENWFAPVMHPAIPAGVAGLASYQDGNVLAIRIPEVADGQPGHYGSEPDRVDGDARVSLHRDGQLVAQAPTSWGDFPASAGPGLYQLDVSVTPAKGGCGPATSTRWTFHSAPPEAGSPALLPVLQLDYDVPVDLSDRALADGWHTLAITARHQEGLRGRKIAGMVVWTSFDDGGSWTPAVPAGRDDAGRFTVAVHHPELRYSSGFVSLRVWAFDDGGNSVVQTVLRAYRLA
jgi:hypothetical protein